MSENRSNSKKKSKRGRPPKHGGYSLIIKDEILKDHPQIRRYLQDCREGLILDIAGSEDKLTEAQRILIDRIISKLSICRLIEIYIEKHGIFRKDKLDKRILELEPALGVNYLAFNNSIRLALGLLGINKRHSEDILTPIELAQRIEEEERRKE